jgi:hypothetical protein
LKVCLSATKIKKDLSMLGKVVEKHRKLIFDCQHILNPKGEDPTEGPGIENELGVGVNSGDF